MSAARKADESSETDFSEVFKVETVPPPPGESDLYNAPTKVGITSKNVLDQMRRDAPRGARVARPPLPPHFLAAEVPQVEIAGEPGSIAAPPSHAPSQPTSGVRARQASSDSLPKVMTNEEVETNHTARSHSGIQVRTPAAAIVTAPKPRAASRPQTRAVALIVAGLIAVAVAAASRSPVVVAAVTGHVTSAATR